MRANSYVKRQNVLQNRVAEIQTKHHQAMAPFNPDWGNNE